MKEIQDKYLYRSNEVALAIAAKANEQKIVINATKLQKLLFITYGSYLSVYDKRLVDEHPESWPSGPVFPRLREDFVSEDLTQAKMSDKRIPVELRKDQKLSEIISFVFRGFGGWTANDITTWCVNSAPCQSTPCNGTSIDDKIIRTFFNSLINK